MFKFLLPLGILVLFFMSTAVIAHPGNTDKFGCHTTKGAGYYHCHTPKDENGKKISKERAELIKAKKEEEQNNDK